MNEFRVWSKDKEIYLFAAYLFIRHDGYLFKYNPSYTRDLQPLPINSHIIEHCIGLKDNFGFGKDIYEGDIIKCRFNYKDNKKKIIAVVELDTANPCYVLRDINNKNNIEYDFVKDGLLELEIIGNIHENTELLKQ